MTPNPSIMYTGPQALRVLFEEEYVKVADQFNREQPHIHVGWMDIEDSPDFESDEALNRFVDEQIQAFQGNEQAMLDGKLSEYPKEAQFAIHLELQKAVGFPNDAPGVAFYDASNDLIHIDPGYATLFFLYRSTLEKQGECNRNMNIPNLLCHELVHFDIGESASEQEVQRIFRNIGVDTLKRLEVHTEKSKKLGLRIVNEACAYACWNEGEVYRKWLADTTQSDLPGVLEVYLAIEKKVATQGRRDTIAEIRDIISKAYNESRDCIGLVLQ